MPWKNPADQAAYQRRYLATPEGRAKHNESCKRNQQRRNQFRIDLLSNFPCHCCGDLDPITIDWHHVYPEQKEFDVKRGLNLPHDVWWNEVLKCIPVCCNCHRKIHKETLCLILPTSPTE